MSTSQINRATTRPRTGKTTDVRPIGAELYLLPVAARVPLKFGAETLTSVTCARVRVNIAGRDGRRAEGWGETPLNVQWTWPSDLSSAERNQAMVAFCRRLVDAWAGIDAWGHPLEIGNQFQHTLLEQFVREFNLHRPVSGQLPHLAGLVCSSPFDIALHDAYGKLHDVPTYTTYGRHYMNCDLADLFASSEPVGVDFRGKFPANYLSMYPANSLPAWHLVGGLDPLDESDLQGDEPDDGYPLLLADWIERDGLICLKVKLRGDDAEWDYDRLVRVGRIGRTRNVSWLSADFNCTVKDPEYVNEILDRLVRDEPQIYGMILYVEQPFPYELDKFRIDVRSVSRRKPLFMDESAHDWKLVRRGAGLGWTGVALKTCKTQTGVLLSMCWARANGMLLMVQDLTNPMLAQVPHVLLAAQAGTIMGVESNAMQFYPDASSFEARIHPGLYVRRGGSLDLSTIHGAGFGYRLHEIARPLPEPEASSGELNGHSDPIGKLHFGASKIRTSHRKIRP